MSAGVTVTVAWHLKPESIDTFVATLKEMFKRTKLRPGFRGIRLLRGDIDKNQFVLLEEWDEARNFHDYVQFRTDRASWRRFFQPKSGS
jgi:heme-degrading monooxygenase HmoA